MAHSTLSSSNQQDGKVIIHSGERLTIENTADFAQLIRAGLAEAKSVDVQFNANLEADITALQVLCSACKTSAATGKVLACHGEMPKSLIDLVAAVGIEYHGECKNDKGDLCLLFGGEK